MLPLMRITFMGREQAIVKGRGVWARLDMRRANEIAREELGRNGIDVRDPTEAVGTLSGG